MFDKKLLQNLSWQLTGHQQTIAVAESVTSGMLQAALSLAPDATQFFQGGITAYNLQQKTRLLNIDPRTALPCNSVSEGIAGDMALHVCALFSSDWGIGVTGYATPMPEVGLEEIFTCYAFAFKDQVIKTGTIYAEIMDVQEVQRWYVGQILQQLEIVVKSVNV